MSMATTKFIVFKMPYQKGFNSLTVAEKNANLEYLTNLLATNLDMVVFNNLTDVDETWGNAYYIGFQNASHASLCIFCPHVNTGDYHRYCIEFVDDNNNPISETAKYQRSSYSQAGFCMYSSYVHETYLWILVITKNNNDKLIQYLYATSQTNPGDAINEAINYMRSTSYAERNASMWVSKTSPYYMHFYSSLVYFINSPINKGLYSEAQWPTDSGQYIIKSYLNPNKKYYTNEIYVYNGNNQSYKFGDPLKAIIFWSTYSPFMPQLNSVFKIDNEYHLVMGKYSDYPVCAWDLGDQYEQINEILI